MLVITDWLTPSDTLKAPLGRYGNQHQNKAAFETAVAASAGTHACKHTPTCAHTCTQSPLALAPRNRHKMSFILEHRGKEERTTRERTSHSD